MVRKVWSLVLLGVMLSCATALAGNPGKEAAAIAAAEQWLAMVDAGRYAASWQEAAGLFRDAVIQDHWVHSLNAVRKPLGRLVSRKVQSKTYTTALPGAPDGEYVVIRFETSFANKQRAIETVTPMMDNDGIWRVSGYYIR
ncbi:DUF4019 domain-containing protein [Desulfuromonas sp. CSMB_57]|uniref:DUF4019 domain-containing protein n=1 Tax=Desulfuromonas sp. CSMB_57 TaxID=2807629 RepID=UPI001CD27C43|nr:DUF4019 domain-containing protein [Desulfuromonas sp. CSMB_57]